MTATASDAPSSFISGHADGRDTQDSITTTHLRNEDGVTNSTQLSHTSFFSPTRHKVNPTRSRASRVPGDANQRRCTEVTLNTMTDASQPTQTEETDEQPEQPIVQFSAATKTLYINLDELEDRSVQARDDFIGFAKSLTAEHPEGAAYGARKLADTLDPEHDRGDWEDADLESMDRPELVDFDLGEWYE